MPELHGIATTVGDIHVKNLVTASNEAVRDTIISYQMSLTDHVFTDHLSELEHLVRLPDYHVYIKKLKTPSGTYCFRVHDARNKVLARSRDFSGKTERDAAYEAFIDHIEIDIHNRRQRRLFF